MENAVIRVEKKVRISKIKPFKFSKINARKIAGRIQNGTEMPPVHLQKVNDNMFRVCNGRDKQIVAGLSILGKGEVLSKYSMKQEVKT